MVSGLVAAGVVGIEEALARAATSPARALGLEDEIGVIAPGARANLLVLDQDLVLETVYVAGVPLAEEGQASAPAGR
jgi:N-acetylglucosamine-6-phosphate deacetylase